VNEAAGLPAKSWTGTVGVVPDALPLDYQVASPSYAPPRAANAVTVSRKFRETTFISIPGFSPDPLYLFKCGLDWQNRADASAGWELVQGLRSWDIGARIICAGLLAQTENAQISTRDLRRSKTLGRRKVGLLGNSSVTEVIEMRTPYGMEAGKCATCKLRQAKWFCSFSPEVLKTFSNMTRPNIFPQGALLFVEGQTPRGAFVLCSGKVKLTTTSRDGKMLILKVAEAGEVLGLSAAISGTPFEVTAETAGPCQLNFIEREALLRMMEKSGELGLHSAQALSTEFQTMYRDVHDLVLARSSAGKLAKLLLSWISGHPGQPANTDTEVRVQAPATHEEMAQMIGASRETVTRLLSDLKKKELIRLEGSTLVIRNRTALEALAA
jgi:CRP/FNR family transcriptional regulator, cyclic AMP receptor protein